MTKIKYENISSDSNEIFNDYPNEFNDLFNNNIYKYDNGEYNENYLNTSNSLLYKKKQANEELSNILRNLEKLRKTDVKREKNWEK